MLTGISFPGGGWESVVLTQEFEGRTRFGVIRISPRDSALVEFSLHMPGFGAESAKFCRRLAQQLLRAADELEEPIEAPKMTAVDIRAHLLDIKSDGADHSAAHKAQRNAMHCGICGPGVPCDLVRCPQCGTEYNIRHHKGMCPHDWTVGGAASVPIDNAGTEIKTNDDIPF